MFVDRLHSYKPGCQDFSRANNQRSKGYVQEGVMSLLLWSLVIDNILREINQRGVYNQGYADCTIKLCPIWHYKTELLGKKKTSIQYYKNISDKLHQKEKH